MAHEYFIMDIRTYKESMDFILSQILIAHLSLDFENLHALIFPLPDRNTLFVTMEKNEHDVASMADYIMRLLQQNEMTYIR